jgi:hypothetical protein
MGSDLGSPYTTKKSLAVGAGCCSQCLSCKECYSWIEVMLMACKVVYTLNMA